MQSANNIKDLTYEQKNPKITGALEEAKTFVQDEMTRLKNEELLKKLEGAIGHIKMLAVKKVGELKLPLPPEIKPEAIDVTSLVTTASDQVTKINVQPPSPPASQPIDLKLLVESAQHAVSSLNIEEPKPIDLEPLVESAKKAMKLKITPPIAEPTQVIKKIRPDVPTVDASKRVKSVVDDGPAFSSGVRFGLEGTSSNDPDGLAKYFVFPFPLKKASQKGGRIYLGGENQKEWNENIALLRQYGVVKGHDQWSFNKEQIKVPSDIGSISSFLDEIGKLQKWFGANEEEPNDYSDDEYTKELRAIGDVTTNGDDD
jgi:hypothetical protein